MSFPYTIRKYEAGDETGILELLNFVFEPRSIEWWQWLYGRNPAGQVIIWLAEDKGAIVGHRPYLPVKVKFGHQTALAGQAIDTAVHPDYHRRGIFTRLTKESLIEATNREWAFIYNFPNQLSYLGYIKAGWVDAYNPVRLVKILNLRNIMKLFLPNEFISQALAQMSDRLISTLPSTHLKYCSHDSIITHDSRFDDAYDQFWCEISPYFQIAIVRDCAYLNWRYVENPLFYYDIFSLRKANKILGFAVLRCSTSQQKLHVGNIMEFLFLPNYMSQAQILLSYITDFFRNKQVDLITLWPVLRRSYIHIFRHHVFFKSPLSKERMTIHLLSTNFPLSILRDRVQWLLSLGDTDWR